MKKVLYLFISWRIFLFLPVAFSQSFLKIRQGFDYTTPLHYIGLHNPIANFLLYPWANFDAVYYLTIAGSGYTTDNAGFFPLFPKIINTTTSILGVSGSFNPFQYLVATVLVLLFTAGSLIVMFKLLSLDYKKDIPFQSVLFLLLFSTSFFLATLYSESLFLFLTLVSFYFARKKKWILSAIFAMLLTATRLVGIAIIPALIFEFYLQNKTFFSKKMIPLILTPLGILYYAWFNYTQWGNPLHFIEAQGKLYNGRSVDHIILFPQTIFRYFKILTTLSISFEWWIALLELSTFIFVSIMLYIAWRKKVRTSYLIFAILAFLIPVSSGTFSGLPRYSLVLFPVFITLALLKNKWIKIIYCAIGIILLFVLLMLFSKGYYVA
ncbi:MAG TPA: mannosyltransferase family protein [Patescibacteria group bacterium]|nr:mannosyltransferase family protein [Patescibacteria group bacterium]